MRVNDVDVRETARGTRLGATVTWGDGARAEVGMLFRDTPAALVTTPGDALVASCLVGAMALGEDLSVDAPVSPRLLASVPRITDFFVTWLPRLHRSEVTAQARAPVPPGSEIGATFSGGIDSFYTILRPRDEPITRLITTLARGRDGIPSNLQRYTATLDGVAADLGLVIVESTLMVLWRTLIPFREEHGNLHWGPSMIAPALALGGTLKGFHIAASWDAEPVPAWNSHPDLDPLWSTENVEVHHDGIVPREDKVPLVATSDAAMRALHVCHLPQSAPVNCGRCVKCLGTMVMFHNLGVADRAVTFPALEPHAVRRVYVTEPWRTEFERLRGLTSDAVLRSALAYALRRTALRRRLRPLGRVLRRLGLLR